LPFITFEIKDISSRKHIPFLKGNGVI